MALRCSLTLLVARAASSSREPSAHDWTPRDLDAATLRVVARDAPFGAGERDALAALPATASRCATQLASPRPERTSDVSSACPALPTPQKSAGTVLSPAAAWPRNTPSSASRRRRGRRAEMSSDAAAEAERIVETWGTPSRRYRSRAELDDVRLRRISRRRERGARALASDVVNASINAGTSPRTTRKRAAPRARRPARDAGGPGRRCPPSSRIEGERRPSDARCAPTERREPTALKTPRIRAARRTTPGASGRRKWTNAASTTPPPPALPEDDAVTQVQRPDGAPALLRKRRSRFGERRAARRRRRGGAPRDARRARARDAGPSNQNFGAFETYVFPTTRRDSLPPRREISRAVAV